MTLDSIRKKSSPLCALILLGITLTLGIIFSGEMGEYVSEGMNLAIRCVIPSSFPFMIISDLYVHYGNPEELGRLGKIIARIVGIPTYMLGAFICGNVGGFPIGAKIAGELYQGSNMKRRDAERLIALSSNPSSAFIIGGVGLGMYNSIRVGFILLISVYSSMLLCALLTRPKSIDFNFSGNNIRQKYNFVASVKQSGFSCISLISFISIFSVAVGMVKNHVKSTAFSYAVITLLEVTNALKIFADSPVFSTPIKLMLSGFALGFGGVSVMMQSALFLEKTDLKMLNYVWIKLLQGALCASVSVLLFALWK